MLPISALPLTLDRTYRRAPGSRLILVLFLMLALESSAFSQPASSSTSPPPPPRERIGSVLGQDVFRDQLDGSQPIATAALQLLVAPAQDAYIQQHLDEILLTEEEWREAIRWAAKTVSESPLSGGRKASKADDLAAKWLAHFDELLKATNPEDHDARKSPSESLLPQLEQRMKALEQIDLQASLLVSLIQNRKLEMFLYDRFGGGNIIFQQLGNEALDAHRQWMLHLEKEGKFEIADPTLRQQIYHYWERKDHPGGLHQDRRWLEFPWSRGYQEVAHP